MSEEPLEEVAPGLSRWSAPHPDWTPEEGGPEGWERDVACTAWASDDGFVLIDPLLPPDGREQQQFWTELDALASAHSVAVDVIVTVPWHERSAGLILERYGKTVGCRVWAHEHAVDRLGCPVTNPFGEKARLPGGIQSLEVERAGEVVLWLAQPRALVVGDALLGRGGGLRLSPADWVGGESNLARIRGSLESARDLPIEMVLVSHGPPVMTDGQRVLADALDAQV